MSQFSPTWVKQSYENDRTSPEAQFNAAKYYNRNLNKKCLLLIDILYIHFNWFFIFFKR